MIMWLVGLLLVVVMVLVLVVVIILLVLVQGVKMVLMAHIHVLPRVSHLEILVLRLARRTVVLHLNNYCPLHNHNHHNHHHNSLCSPWVYVHQNVRLYVGPNVHLAAVP